MVLEGALRRPRDDRGDLDGILHRPLSDFVVDEEWSVRPSFRSADARHWHIENGEWKMATE